MGVCQYIICYDVLAYVNVGNSRYFLEATDSLLHSPNGSLSLGLCKRLWVPTPSTHLPNGQNGGRILDNKFQHYFVNVKTS